jgi:hypothetical protein
MHFWRIFIKELYFFTFLTWICTLRPIPFERVIWIYERWLTYNCFLRNSILIDWIILNEWYQMDVYRLLVSFLTFCQPDRPLQDVFRPCLIYPTLRAWVLPLSLVIAPNIHLFVILTLVKSSNSQLSLDCEGRCRKAERTQHISDELSKEIWFS